MNLWIVSMECAGIAEAGGVKNVTYSLCKEFSALNNNTTLFIPVFGCNSWDDISDKKELFTRNIQLCGRTENVTYTSGHCISGNFNVVFINHKCYSEKEAVYCYTENEEQKNPEHKKGNGHSDFLFKDVLFQKAVAEYGACINISDLPQIIHSQDASTALIPALIFNNPVFKNTKTVVTIHNAGPAYHHEFPDIDSAFYYTGLDKELLQKALNGNRVEPFLLAALCNSYLTTVSEKYAEEIMDSSNVQLTDGLAPLFSALNIKIKGITNGFDFDRYNPEFSECSLLPFAFSPEKLELSGKFANRNSFLDELSSKGCKNYPGIRIFGKISADSQYKSHIYFCYHGRITGQKGISILAEAIPVLLKKYSNIKFIIAGQGEPLLENKLIQLSEYYEGNVLYLNGYNRIAARLCTAISDFIILPSFFEPCGLEDFIAQNFGTIPIAHRTGGLTKIINNKTGFLYDENTVEELTQKISEVINIYQNNNSEIYKIIQQGAESVRIKYNWTKVIKDEYFKFFSEIIKKN